MYQEQSSGGIGILAAVGMFICVLVLVAVMGSFKNDATLFSDHSQTSHPEQVPDINRCFTDPNSTLSTFYQMDNGRWAQHCFNQNINGKNFFWRVFDCDASGNRIVVTQFKQALRQLEKYIRNKGMTPGAPAC